MSAESERKPGLLIALVNRLESIPAADLPATHRLVLLCLADTAGTADRACWKGPAKIGLWAGLSADAVDVVLRELEAAGWISGERRWKAPKVRDTTLWRLTMDSARPVARARKGGHSRRNPGCEAPQVPGPVPPSGAGRATPGCRAPNPTVPGALPPGAGHATPTVPGTDDPLPTRSLPAQGPTHISPPAPRPVQVVRGSAAKVEPRGPEAAVEQREAEPPPTVATAALVLTPPPPNAGAPSAPVREAYLEAYASAFGAEPPMGAADNTACLRLVKAMGVIDAVQLVRDVLGSAEGRKRFGSIRAIAGDPARARAACCATGGASGGGEDITPAEQAEAEQLATRLRGAGCTVADAIAAGGKLKSRRHLDLMRGWRKPSQAGRQEHPGQRQPATGAAYEHPDF